MYIEICDPKLKYSKLSDHIEFFGRERRENLSI